MLTTFFHALSSLLVVLSLAACGNSRMTAMDLGPSDSHVGPDGAMGEGGADAGDGGAMMDARVDGAPTDGATGDMTMTDGATGDMAMTDGAAGDASASCPDADLGMMVGVAVRTGTTVGAAVLVQPSCVSGGADVPGLRFSWTAPTTGTYAIDALGSTFDTVLAVLDATCGGTELDCNDDNPNGSTTLTSRIDLPATAGHVYVIVLTGLDGATGGMEGAYTLNITQPPADEVGACADGMDNDRDGDADCADSDCSGLPICVAPNCGNGVTDTGETCDDTNAVDGDGCDRFCQVEVLWSCTGAPSFCTFTCGNGTVDTATGEECDDGNTTAGDRCDSTCLLESTRGEFEPNDALADATTVGDGEMVRGSLESATDVDLFTFTLTAPAQLDLETYTTIDGSLANYDGTGTLGPRVDCPTEDTVVRLFSATGDVTMDGTALASDDNDGDGNCSFLGAADSTAIYLGPGTYTIKLTGAGGALVPLYILDVKLTPAVAPTVGSLVINEFMANPGAAAAAVDANCDGTGSSNDDEFVELVNTTATFLDLTGVTISDMLATPTVRHAFAPRGLAPHAAVVVYGGGASMCAGVSGDVANAAGNSLGLNNTNDGITVATAAAAVLCSAMYATSVASVSANLSPDLNDTVAGTDTGPFVRHNLVPGAAGDFSPGKRVDGTPF